VKRTTLLIIPALLLVVLVAAVLFQIPSKAGLPQGVQTRLDQYLASPFAKGTMTLRLAERARRPWNLTQAMGFAVLGDSVYFQTDSSLTWEQGGGPSPLPFPPKELWCALLEAGDEGEGDGTQTVVFIGLHMDMYNGDWIVHQGPEAPFSPEFLGVLSSIGCMPELD
jgi:hypothetical protein